MIGDPSMPESKRPRRSRTWLIGVSGLAVALALAGFGVASRLSAHAAMKTEAAEAAVPTVIVASPQAAPAVEEVVLPGQVKGLLETPIYARTSGYVKAWKTDIGARVAAGQLLAQIDSPEVDQQLRQAQADLKTAQANAAVAKSTSDRVQGLVATQSVSRQEGEDRAAGALAAASQVSAQEANVARLRQLAGFERVTAPYAGVITARSTDVGNLVNAGSGIGPELFRIADISRLRTYVQAPQSYAGRLAEGTKAELQFSDHPGKVYPATVTRTAHALDPQTRTLLVELDLDNATGTLFPGSFVEAHFKLPAAQGAARLSGNTLLFRAEGLRVAAVGPDNLVTLKPVTLGRDFGVSVEVLGGVRPGDRIILNPPASIETGDMVHVVQAKTKAAKS
jgi:RND family efflux transporter MFP subunit